jgi:hypothetical protein
MLTAVDQDRLPLETEILHDQGLQIAEFEGLVQLLAEQLFGTRAEQSTALFIAVGDSVGLIEYQDQAVGVVGDPVQRKPGCLDLFGNVHDSPSPGFLPRNNVIVVFGRSLIRITHRSINGID